MDESHEPPATGWKRAKDVLNQARVTGEILVTGLNPLYGQVAQQAHLEPVADPAAIRQEIERDEEKQYAHQEIESLKEEAGRLEHKTSQAKPGEAREARPDRRPGSVQSRHRQPGR